MKPTGHQFFSGMTIPQFLSLFFTRNPDLKEYTEDLKNWAQNAKNLDELKNKQTGALPPRLKISLELSLAEAKMGMSTRMSYTEEFKTVNIPLGRPLFVFDSDYKPPSITTHEMIKMALDNVYNENKALFSMVEQRVEDTLKRADSQDFIRQHRLKEEEALAIIYYTSDVRDYGGDKSLNIYFCLNKVLCQRKVPEQWQPYLFTLLSGMNKLPNIEKYVYRYLDVKVTKVSKQYGENNKIVWIAFTSTSDRFGTVRAFANIPGSASEGGTFLKILVTEGKDIGCLSIYPEEGEIVLLPNTELRILQVLKPDIIELVSDKVPEKDHDYVLLRQEACEHGSMILPNPFDAAYSGNLNNLKHWLSVHSKEINIIDTEHNDSPLLYTAARAGRLEIVKYLIEQKANLNAVQTHGSTALHAASYYGHLEIVKLLVENGIDTRIKNRWGITAHQETQEQLIRSPNDQKMKEIYDYLASK